MSNDAAQPDRSDSPPEVGETDLAAMLKTITVTVRPDTYVVVSLPLGQQAPRVGEDIAAVIMEDEGATVVTTLKQATHSGWDHHFVASWLTIQIHSSLEAVGLTAAFSRQLGRAAIPCNVIAGFYHDHILVPVDKTDAAVEVIESLSGQN